MANKPDWLLDHSAAIPIFHDNGILKVVLVTTKPKQKGNWIFPKGKVELGLSAFDSAAKEAYEEAGVMGQISSTLLDEYDHDKWGGRMSVKVYTLDVHSIMNDWKEKRDRDRQILTLDEAINTVHSAQKKSLLKLKQQLKPTASSITPSQLNDEMKAGTHWVLLDVREHNERSVSGVLSHYDVHIPLGLVEDQVGSKIKDRHAQIVVYCAKGIRGATAANTLTRLGYTNVTNLSGGLQAWEKAGLKTCSLN